MNTNNNQSSQIESIGCLAIIAMLVFAAIAPILIEFIKFLLIAGAIGGVGYFAFKVINDPEWTERFERWFNLEKKSNIEDATVSEYEAEILGLPSAKRDPLLEEISSMKDKMETLEEQNRKRKKKQKKKIKEALKANTERIAQQNKQALLHDLFGETPGSYTESDEFERRAFEEQKKKTSDQLDIRELRQDLKEQLFEQEREIAEVRMEGKEDRTSIRMEMKDGFIQVDQMLIRLENKVIALKGYFDEKFSQMEITVFREITSVKETIMNLRSEVERNIASVNNELANIKVSFGKEIVRLDRAQIQIVNQLGQYENKLRQYAVELIGIKNRAERSEIRGQRLLEQAQVVYQKHRADMQVMGKNIERGLEQISFHKSDFALKAGRAKLQLDKITQEQYLELRNISFAEMGVKALRQDYAMRENLGLEKMKNLVAEKRRVDERIREHIAHGKETASLQHRANMLQERVQHANQQNTIMRKEFAVFRQLSR